MATTSGYYATPKASQYLQQLCKHFGHKIDVEFTETTGTCQFVFGPATMTADEAGLTVSFELNDEAAIPAARNVIDSHLVKFAFREEFTAMDWT